MEKAAKRAARKEAARAAREQTEYMEEGKAECEVNKATRKAQKGKDERTANEDYECGTREETQWKIQNGTDTNIEYSLATWGNGNTCEQNGTTGLDIPQNSTTLQQYNGTIVELLEPGNAIGGADTVEDELRKEREETLCELREQASCKADAEQEMAKVSAKVVEMGKKALTEGRQRVLKEASCRMRVQAMRKADAEQATAKVREKLAELHKKALAEGTQPA